MKRIQCDRMVVDAPFFLPKLQKYVSLPELQNWDFRSQDESKALALYRRFMDLLMEKWHVNESALYRLLDQLSGEQAKEMEEILTIAKSEVKNRNWGEIHRVSFSHLSKNEEWIFSPDESGIGDNHSIDPGTAKWNPDRKVYEQFSGASMRMIIEMDESPRIFLSLPGVNRDYTEVKNPGIWKDWRNCQYSEIKF